jgi:cytochrome c-type biogenesis protein CcmE
MNDDRRTGDLGFNDDTELHGTGPALATGVDLTPRTTGPVVANRKRKLGAPALLALVLVAAGFVVWQFLSNATMFFCNADEVGHRSECMGDKRFRLQGTVVKGTVVNGTPTTFLVAYKGTSIPVQMGTEPNGIFREDIPVVIEGRMVGGTFQGDRLLVKHDEKYVAQNPDRVKDYGET